MSKRLWTGLLVGLIGAMALVAVGVGAFHAGERHEITTVAPVVGAVPGETVRVVGYGHWGGPPFGFLFPLLIIALIVVLVAGRRRAHWGHHPWGPGPWGAGPGGWGGPCGPGGREAALADWHRQAHDEPAATPGAAADQSGAGSEPPGVV